MLTEAKYIPIPKTITAELAAEIREVPRCTAIFVSPLCATNAGRSKLKQQLREAGVPEAVVRASGYATASPTPREISSEPTAEISPPPAEKISRGPRHRVEIAPSDVGEISDVLGDTTDDGESDKKTKKRGRRKFGDK